MEPYRRRLQLDRQELMLLFCVFVLVSGLMFTLGLMMGYGMHSRGVALGDTPARGEAIAEGKEGRSNRSPASREEKGGAKATAKAAESGANEGDGNQQKLSKALEADKQKALNEMALHENASEEPKSVEDARAHFAANPPPANREPASEPVEEKPAEKIEAKKNSTDRVKNLFERRAASIDRFQPTPGAYTVQIASFASEDESSSKVKLLRQSGFNESYVQAIRLQNGETWYRVAIGSYPSPAWAKKTGEKLVRRKLAGDFVIRKIP